ncbi:hypothetical protein GQ44DRAFT_626663 [Phaeosphaeriaceae sp. PMI808]|nr:hypothetical protein GQ44DRAFT_626663 [Phaeosphaeriaceae sp. PMI808]
MKNCNHTSWLSFHGKQKIMLRHASTLSDMVASLDAPGKKFPSLIAMIGDADNATLRSHAVPSTRKRAGYQEPDGIHLQLDPDTAFSDRPVFITHEKIPKRSTFASEPMSATCHRHTVRELQWEVNHTTEAFKNLYCRLIQPFADVVCFFFTDDNDTQRHVERIVSWLEQSYSPDCHHPFRPRLLLISSSSEERSLADVQAHLFKLIQQRLKHPRPDLASFVSVYVKHSSTQTLKDRIKREADISRNLRTQNHISLNAIHFDLLFSHAYEHFASTGQEPFNMLAASRLHRPVPASLQTHIASLFKSVESLEDTVSYVVPFVAGCLALDNYAYDVHFFDPEEVFAFHYKSVCMAAAENRMLSWSGQVDSSVLLLRTKLVTLIKKHFLHRSRTFQPGAKGRLELLRQCRPWLSQVKIHTLCLTCLKSVPEHKFPCGHMVCEECYKDLGRSHITDPHFYEFDHCPLCEIPCNVALRVKPITAGFRVLSIDGGGIRAMIPIQFLRALEQAVGLDIPIQEHFDLSYGTSSGAMVNLALYGLGMRIDEVCDLFKQLSTRIFRGRSRIGFGFPASAHALLVSYRDGRFPAEDIEGALSDLFKNTTMLDHPYMSSIGARTAFPVVNANTLETCIVTSYNGAVRGQDHGNYNRNMTYKVLRSEEARNEILIRQVIRFLSYRNRYFTPDQIAFHGTFIDGGVSDNNPSILAMQELQRIAPELRRPDQFISIGTGICRARQTDDTETHSSFFFGNNSLQQTFKHYWNENFDGDKKFASMRDMMAVTIPDGAADIDQWLRRFNLPLDGELPDLSDAQAMDGLANAAWAHFTSHPTLHDLSLAILASNFYFELRCMPMYEKGYYTCYGRILCRIPVTKPAFPALMQKLRTLGAHFLVQKQTSRERKSMSISFDRTGNFSKPFCLRVKNLEDQLDVRLKFLGTRDYHISASPFPINTLIKLQKLEWNRLSHISSQCFSPTKKRRASDCNSRVAKRRCLKAL